LIAAFSSGYSQQYGWKNIGGNLPNTVSTATISDIAVAGDSMWVTSGYGTYLNGVPGEIYFSADRGNTFTIQTTKYGTHAIHMQNAQRGWCGGVEGQVYHTSNGGATWDRLFSLGRTLMDIDFPPGSDTGICTGFTGGVKILTPSGLITVDMQGYVSNIYSVSCIDRNHAFIAGEEIIAPVIQGVMQIDQSYPGTNGIYAIDMIDTLQGWCVGSPTAAGAYDSAGCMIIHTSDGHNWESQVNPVKGKNGTLMAVKAINSLEAWTVGTSGVILHTTDGGVNWIREAEGLTDEMLYGIWVVNNKEVYVTGNNRTLLKYGTMSGMDDTREADRFIRVFPNPVIGKVSIQSKNNQPINRISVVDISGRQLMLVEQPAIREIDLSGLQGGLYFLAVRCAEKTCMTKIMKQ